MILTCPDCATRYFVADDKVGPEGRSVKCAACGNRWTARAESPLLELTASSEEGALAVEAREPEPDPEPISALPGEELPKVFRAKAVTERRVREAAATGVIWAGMSIALAAMIVGAVVFRVDMVRLWPSSAGAFASVGLPVNRIGLVIEEVSAEPALQDGHAALSVSGVIRNIEDVAVAAPPLRITLLNREGKRVMGKIAAPADPKIPPGETRHFAIALIDPPTTASDLEVTFALASGGKPARAAPSVSQKLALRGAKAPAPVPPVEAAEAAPLPAGSPYALPEHHE